MGTIDVELFVDVSCPWCHGALEGARGMLDELAADPDVPALAVRWRFLRLHEMPTTEGLSLDEYLGGDARDPDRIAKGHEMVRAYAASTGTRVDFGRYTWVHDPFTAHRLLAAVRDDAGDDVPSLWSVARVVFSANFASGADIADLTVLRGSVERAGLRLPARIWERVDAGGYAAETLADHARALDVELDGVPRMLIGDEIVPIWLERDEVQRLVREALATASGSSSPAPRAAGAAPPGR